MPRFTHLLLVVLILAAAIAHTGICNAADAIRINGSGNGLDMMKPLIDVYRKSNDGVRIDMKKSLGSSGAVKALLAGALDIAVVSRDLKPEEAAQGAVAPGPCCRRKGRLTRYCRGGGQVIH